jgi:Fur family transcriptional regulator, ferric uptake regulator
MKKKIPALEERLSALVHDKGGRDSRRRRAVTRAVEKAMSHLTAEEVLHKARKSDPSIGPATVYRTLNLLRDAGLVREIRDGRGPSSYELLRTHHDHLVCVRCGRVEEISDPSIEKRQNSIYGRFRFKPVSHTMQLYGICPECGNKEKNQ